MTTGTLAHIPKGGDGANRLCMWGLRTRDREKLHVHQPWDDSMPAAMIEETLRQPSRLKSSEQGKGSGRWDQRGQKTWGFGGNVHSHSIWDEKSPKGFEHRDDKVCSFLWIALNFYQKKTGSLCLWYCNGRQGATGCGRTHLGGEYLNVIGGCCCEFTVYRCWLEMSTAECYNPGSML